MSYLNCFRQSPVCPNLASCKPLTHSTLSKNSWISFLEKTTQILNQDRERQNQKNLFLLALWERVPTADLHLLRNHCEEKLLKMQILFFFLLLPPSPAPSLLPKLTVWFPSKENPPTAISACPNRL